MKKLSLFVIASIIALSVSAQTKPKTTAEGGPIPPKRDTTVAPKFPKGQYFLTFDVETATDVLKAMQQTDYSKSKTDKALMIILQQMRFEETQWAKEAEAPKKDSTQHK